MVFPYALSQLAWRGAMSVSPVREEMPALSAEKIKLHPHVDAVLFFQEIERVYLFKLMI
jgi:hypothetical protein